MIKLFIIAVVFLSITSCSSLPKYISPTTGELSKIELERSFETELPGSSTIINKYKMKDTSKCFQDMEILDAKKLITVTDSNPLIFEFNPNGVNVRSEEELVLQIATISGPTFCRNFIGFKSQRNQDYKLKLSGSLLDVPPKCNVELWSKNKITNTYTKQKLNIINVCD